MTESNITTTKISSIRKKQDTSISETIALIREKLDLIETELQACKRILRGEKE